MPRTIAFVVARIRRDAIGLATLRSSRSGPANAAARYRIRPISERYANRPTRLSDGADAYVSPPILHTAARPLLFSDERS
jgi:hypothetical protein